MATKSRQVVAVTGGGTGVGRAVVLQFAQRGFDIALFYCSSKCAAESTAAEALALGASVLVQRVDVASDSSVKEGIAAALTHFGRIDVLVNSAAVTQLVPFSDLDAVRLEVPN